ncbi:unnamed protein product [Ostreobium quekettii]|uniref:Telomerase reverse transcriptase n=1 Tax=Ostreobium quekettii TaxID=121088 RepID=A0A8S1IVH8_9CHLO|nr:unnamed protein product [Ostreobium quekettii]
MLQPSSAPTGPLSCKDSCMVRLVDDFLVISASRSKAEGVLRCLQSGIPGRKIDLNNEKTKANFRVPVVGGALEPNVYRDGASCFVPWCGLLINTESLEIQADYRRHLKGHVRSSLNVTLSKRPVRQLKLKLCLYLRPKCHPLLFDPAVNGPATIRLNIYQAFLLCAVKLHCSVSAISWSRRPRQSVLLSAIQSAISYMGRLLRSRMATAQKSTGGGCGNTVSRCHVTWLGLTGFCFILRRKQSAYKDVLGWMEQERRREVYRHLWRHLRDVVDERKSLVFCNMIY